MTDLSIGGKGITKGRALSLTSLGHFINDGTLFLFPLLVDIVLSVKLFAPVFAAVFLTVFYVIGSVFSLVVGRVADRGFSLGKLIGLGLFLYPLGLLGFYFIIEYHVSSFPIALISTLSMGVASSFYHPLGASVLQESYGSGSTGTALGINGAIGSAGRALYPSLLFVVAAVLTLADSFLFFAVLAAVAAVVIASGLRNCCKQTETHGVKGKALRNGVTIPLILLTILAFVKSVATQGIISWIPIYLSNVKGLGLSDSLGYTLSLMFVGGIAGQPVFGYLTRKFDKRILLSLTSFGTAVTILGYINTMGMEALAMLGVFGFFTFSGFPLLLSIIQDYVQGTSSTANSVVWGLGSQGGMAVGPAVVGLLALNDYSGLTASFYLMIVLIFVVGTAFLFMPKSSTKKKRALF